MRTGKPSTNRKRFLRRRCAKRRLLVESLESRRCLSAGPWLSSDAPQIAIDPGSYDSSSLIVRLREDAAPIPVSGQFYGPSQIVASTSLGFGLQKLSLSPGVSAEALRDRFENNHDFIYAELDYRVYLADLPNDPQFPSQWDLHNTGQEGGTIDADIDAPEAWEVTTGSGSTVVAVIDTGVDYLHPDLSSNMWINADELPGDGIDNDGNGYIDDVHGYDFFNNDGSPMDDHNHGTHVAGTIGAVGNDGTGIAGVHWNTQIMAIKFLGADGSGSTSGAIASIQYAVDNGAHISNNSWGGDPYSQALFDVIRDAGDQGHVFVAAAGNGNSLGIGQDNDATPFYPASYELDNIVAVAATDRNDGRGFFSNYGATSVDLGAPGVDILSTTINGTYGTSSGTSMAAPHVTGAMSLLRDHDPTLTPQQMIDRVLLSADPVDSMAGITVTGGRLNVAAALIPDTIGPRIDSIEPSGLVLDPFSTIRVSFNEAIDSTTFTLDDIEQFTGPQGNISVTGLQVVSGSNGRQFDLTFASQSKAGLYELRIAPEITDRFGNVMDQNENGVGGEVVGDVFVRTITKADAVGRFDFGTSTSPVATGYTAVTGGDRYSQDVGYGWQAGAVYSLNRGGDALTRDVNYTVDAEFALDLPNGEYDVITTLGETIAPHDEMGIFLEGNQVDAVTTAAGQFARNVYRTSVSDGQLTLGLRDLGGSDNWVMINGLDVVFAGPDATGPRVTSTDAQGTISGPIDRIKLVFNEPIEPGSFTLDDVIILEGPTGPITPTAIEILSTGEFQVVFDPQNDPGEYRIAVGPAVTDVAGNLMDQDGDGNPGEDPDDRFESIFTLEAGLETVAKFDFGTTTSPVADGFTQVINSNSYDAAVGYGWLTGPVYSVNRGGDPLTRDLNYTKDGEFALDLPNGEYELEVTMGEALIAHDEMGVFIEGVQVDNVSSAAYEYVRSVYRASVSDSQLNLRIHDLGGSNTWAVINALEVRFVGPDTSGPFVDSTDAMGNVVGPIDRIQVVFNETIQADTFDLSDIVLFEGPGGAITPIAIETISPGEFEITFEPQNESGAYRLEIGPEILDAAGNAMDQDGDGVAGEVPDDRFIASFDLTTGSPTVARFDFGTASSDVAEDYVRISNYDRYSVETGYGWQSSSVYSVNRGGDALTRDLNYTADATFAIDLPDGQYEVIVTMGEALIAHDQMAIDIEGIRVDTVSTASFQYVVNQYTTQVSDGQLNLRLKDLGGNNAWAVINGLEILRLQP